MKKVVFLLVVLLGISPCFAKRKPKLTYDHVGKITYHIGLVKDHSSDFSDWYESGEHICVGGDEHHAPLCLKSEDWVYRDKLSIDVSLEDGTQMTFTSLDCPSQSFANHDFCNVMESLARLSRSRKDSMLPRDGDVEKFRYLLSDGDIFMEVHDMLKLSIHEPKPTH